MKKTRILSLLLAATTMASALPVVVSAAEEDKTPLGRELLTESDVLDSENWTYGDLDVESVEVSESGTNTELYMYDAKEHQSNTYTYTLKAQLPAGTYRIKMDINNQMDGVEQFEDVFGCRINGAHVWSSKDDLKGATNTYSRDITLASDATQIPVVFNLLGDGQRLGMIFPRYIDNIRVYELEDGVEASEPVVIRTFEDGLENGDTWVKNIAGATTAVDALLATENDYIRVEAIAKNGTVEDTDYTQAAIYTPGDTVTLTPGVYEFTFDGRMSYFFSTSSHNNEEYVYEYNKLLEEDENAKPARGFNSKISGWDSNSSQWQYWNSTESRGFWGKTNTVYHKLYRQDLKTVFGDYNYRDVAVSIIGENAETGDVDVLGTDTVTVQHYWQDGYKVTFTVPAGETYTLEGISFGGTGYAYDNDAFDVSDFTLKCVEEFYEPEEIPEIYGDADNDGKVNPLDVVYLARYVAKWADYTDDTVNAPALDLDDDGEITVQDITVLARHIAKWIGYETLPYGE